MRMEKVFGERQTKKGAEPHHPQVVKSLHRFTFFYVSIIQLLDYAISANPAFSATKFKVAPPILSFKYFGSQIFLNILAVKYLHLKCGLWILPVETQKDCDFEDHSFPAMIIVVGGYCWCLCWL